MAESGRDERRVLVVEDRAHRPVGHFPYCFAELAEGFAANGCRVEVLTSRGWLREGDGPEPFLVRRYGRLSAFLCRVGESLGSRRGLCGIAGGALRTLGLVHAARSVREKAGEPAPAVMAVSVGVDPLVASVFAGRGRWLFYQHGGPSRALAGFSALAARAERRRRSAGGCARIAVPNGAERERWKALAPFLDPVTIAITGSRHRQRIPDARLRLGLNADDHVALLFGTRHDGKDIDLVARVFAELPDWQVVVAGRAAHDYRQRTGAREAIVVGGYLDDTMRDVVYSAADLVVLSYRPEFQRSSAVLMDALSFGVPVVCSDGSPAADIVREYRLGLVFEPGHPDSLARAVRNVPAHIDPADLARARTDLSNQAVAARFWSALHGSAR
jgi:glycosyltransferase involved in cell wall biosynthesis